MADSRKGENPLLNLKSHWEESAASIWFASSLRLYRNYGRYAFPGKIASEQRQHVLDLVQKGFQQAPGLDHPKFYPAEQISASDKEYLFEHFLMTEGIHQAQKGDGFVLDEQGHFCGIVNVRNHLQLSLVVFSKELEEAYNRLTAVEDHLGHQANFAFSERFGFLTAEPHRVGTGLVATAFLHLPALIHTKQLEEEIRDLRQEGLLTFGIQGDPQELIGDVLLISNAYTLGVKEEAVLSSVRRGAMRIMLAEERAHKTLRDGNNGTALKDLVSRALGVATHSYQLGTVEALGTLSLLKLGVDLGWLTGLTPEVATEAFFHCRRAHLTRALSREISKADESKERASYIHQVVKDVNFVGGDHG